MPDAANLTQVPPTPVRWGAHMRVQHRITGDIGEVLSVDFEEDLVEVRAEWGEVHWRIENTFEVRP